MKGQIPAKPHLKYNPKNYIEFNELTNFPKNEDLIDMMKKINNLVKIVDNWNDNMEAINLLRRLNKFRQTFFNTNFDAHFKYLATNYLNSPRSCIVKITLMLIAEIFTEIIPHAKFPEWIEALIPVVIKKSVLDKNFIQEEAKNVLKNFTKKIHNTEGLLILLKTIQDKNFKYSSKAYEMFLDIIEEFDIEKLKGIKWENIFKELIEISKLKKDPYPKRFKNLFLILLKKLGMETIEKMQNEMLNLEDYLLFSKINFIAFNEICKKFIDEENGKSKKTKEKITLQDHILSLKNSEKFEKEKFEGSNEINAILVLQPNEYLEIKENENLKFPSLVLTSSQKSEGLKDKKNGENEIESVKKEIIIEENPLKNPLLIGKNSSRSESKKKICEENINEERPKGSIEIELIKSSKKNKDQENIVN